MRVEPGMAAPYSGALDCALKTVRAEGPMALYKGFIPTISRQGPFTVVLFVTLEQNQAFKFNRDSYSNFDERKGEGLEEVALAALDGTNIACKKNITPYEKKNKFREKQAKLVKMIAGSGYQWVGQMSFLGPPSFVKVILSLGLVAAVYQVWLERNARILKNKARDPSTLFQVLASNKRNRICSWNMVENSYENWTAYRGIFL
ncbi:hypothetical protein C3L33_10742, partial [Rhododendron williamsianum]